MGPGDLLHPSRLDVIVKYLYFQSLHQADPDVETRRLYVQHIARRTGGVEDTKRTVSDYENAARQLLASIDATGFDDAYAVPLGSNGLPNNGAHRFAACLALNRPIAVRSTATPGPDWGFEWFAAHGFSPADTDRLIRTYTHLSNRAVALIFWGPTIGHWPALMAALAAHAPVVGWRDLTVAPADVAAIVHDVYAYRLGPRTNDRIEAKARALAAARPNLRVVVVDAPATGARLEAWSTQVKAELRRIAGRGPDDFFDTVHTSDTVDETRYLVDLLLDGNSLRRLASRRGLQIRPQFLEWLTTYRAALAKHGLRQEDACIVGSAVLEVIGLREATDIDCIVSSGTRRSRFHGGIASLAADVDLVTAGYHRRTDEEPVVSDDQLVADSRHHFLYRGLKFANPELVIDRKRQQARPKDLADVTLWDARGARRDTPNTPPADRCVVFWDPTPIDAVNQASWQTRGWAYARRGVQAILAGPSRTPAFFTLRCIEGPPSPDELPVEVMTEVDPAAALAQIGCDGAQLLEMDPSLHGTAPHPGLAIRRLGALAATARWMERWLTAIAPDVLVVPSTADAHGLLLASIAKRTGVQLVHDAQAADTALRGVRRDRVFDTAAATAACSSASEWSALARSAAMAEALEARVRNQTALTQELEISRAATSILSAAISGRHVWIWGAGSAGMAVAAWLRELNVPLRGAVDSDPAKRGSLFADVRVQTPEVLLDMPFHSGTPLIVVASMHAEAIVDHLRQSSIADAHMLVAPVTALLTERA